MSERIEPPAPPGALARALSVRAGETAHVRALFIAAFSLGVSLVFFYGGANALFLSRYQIDALGWVYVANGILAVAAGVAYSRFARDAGPAKTIVSCGWVMAASVALLWLLAVASDADWVAFALATWFRMLFIFSVLGLWELASAVFDIRQAKRLFPAVALGMMLAYMIGGAATAPIVAVIGTSHLVLVSAVAMVAHTMWMAHVVSEQSVARLLVDVESVETAGPSEILRHPFTRRLGQMRAVTVLLIYLTEFVFYEQAAAAFETDDSLAGFLGTYIAGMTLAMVVIGATVAGWWLQRFGVGVGLATLPATALALALFGGLWALVRGTEGFFFVIAALLYGLTQITANTIEPPAGALLFQPLPAARRMPLRVAVDGWLGSVALVVVGAVLLILRALPFSTVTPVVLLIVVVGGWGIWLATVLFSMYRDLLRSVTRVAFSRVGSDHTPPGRLVGAGLLPTLLATDHREPNGSSALPTALDVPVLEALADTSVDMVTLGVAASAELDAPGPEVMAALAAVVERSALARSLRSDALVELARRDPELATQLARSSGSDLADAVWAIDMSPANSSAAQAETTATRVALAIKEGGSHRADGLRAANHARHLGASAVLHRAVDPSIEDLLYSVDPDEIDAAFASAPLEPSAAACKQALVLGRSARHEHAAATMLQRAPLRVLDLVVDEADRSHSRWASTLRASVVPAITRRPTVLYPAVEPGKPSAVRGAGFEALVRADVMPPASPLRMLADDAVFVGKLAAAWRDLEPQATDPLVAAVRWALEDEFAQAQRTLLAALQFDHDRGLVRDVADIIERQVTDVDAHRATAIESLDVALDAPLRALVLPLLEPASLHEAVLEGLADEAAHSSADSLTQLAANTAFASVTRKLARVANGTNDEDPMNSIIDRALALRKVDIFAGLPIELAIELAERSEERTFAAGEPLIQAGSVGREVFALINGRAQVLIAEGAPVELDAGTVVGELAVLDPAPRSASVIATEACTALVVDRATLLDLVSHRPAVMTAIAGVLARRLRST